MKKSLFALVLATALLSAGQAYAAQALPPVPGGGGGNSHASLTIITHTMNDNGGIALPSAVLMTYGDGISWTQAWAGFDLPGFSIVVPVGPYVIQGTNLAGYVRTYSPSCSGSLAEDGSATCIVTYDDVPPGTPGCEAGCDTIPTNCGVVDCDPTVPAGGCPPESPDCPPIAPPETPGTTPCVPSSPDCSPMAPSENGSQEPNGTTSTEELPRTGGGALPVALALIAVGTTLMSRKRS